MWSRLPRPNQSCFWMPRLVKPTDVSRQLRLHALEEQWLKQYTSIPNLGMQLNSYKFCDNIMPAISDDQLLSAMKYFDWFFYFDDQFDYRFDNEECRQQRDQMLRGIQSRCCHLSEQNPDNVNMFFSIAKEIINFDNSDACDQFHSDLQWYFNSADWMISMKKMKRSLPMDTYLQHRAGDIGVWPMIDFMLAVYDEFNEEGVIKRIYSNPRIKEVQMLCAMHCAMVNDILSLNKDIDENALPMNGVFILHEQKTLQSQEEAMNDAISLCNHFFLTMCDKVRALKKESFYFEHKASLNIFFDVCENVLIQNIDWHYLSERYE
eukprot:223622_1